MRILRLYAPSLIGDHTLCYVHSNSAGESCVNEVPIDITCAAAGADLIIADQPGFALGGDHLPGAFCCPLPVQEAYLG